MAQHSAPQHCCGTAATLRLILPACPLALPLRSPPVIDAKPLGPTSGEVVITPPTENGPWAKYVCKVCVKGTTTCTTLPACTANPAPATTTCPILNLTPATTYTVECDAEKDNGDKTPVSAPSELTTEQAPAPKIHAEATSGTTATTDVTPPAGLPGPWASYELKLCTPDSTGTCKSVTCSPVNTPPANTTCPLTGLTPGTKYTVDATAVAPDGSKSKTAVPDAFETPTAGAPAVAADPNGNTAGVAHVTPPLSDRPWATYDLKVCVKGTADCRNITGCVANANKDAVTDCPIPGCTPDTTYDVWATAQKTGLTSPQSAPDDFTTDKYP